MLLNAGKCQGYSLYHFWVIKRKPQRTMGEVIDISKEGNTAFLQEINANNICSFSDFSVKTMRTLFSKYIKASIQMTPWDLPNTESISIYVLRNLRLLRSEGIQKIVTGIVVTVTFCNILILLKDFDSLRHTSFRFAGFFTLVMFDFRSVVFGGRSCSWLWHVPYLVQRSLSVCLSFSVKKKKLALNVFLWF